MILLLCVCGDCKELSHYTKAYFKCKLYKQIGADGGKCLVCYEQISFEVFSSKKNYIKLVRQGRSESKTAM